MLAQNLNEIESLGLPGNKIPFSLGPLISSVLLYVYGAAGMALLIYFVIGGFQLMLAKGDPKAIQAAQGKITSALIGFVIVIIAFTLTQLIGQLLGINAFSLIFGGGGGASIPHGQ